VVREARRPLGSYRYNELAILALRDHVSLSSSYFPEIRLI
jgi:hypothetical protein